MLKRIHIENFKSLKNVTLDLQPVNLLIGPNNSGKSNLLKALEFMSSFITKKFIGENSVKNLTYLHEYINRTIIVKVTNLYEEDTENSFNNYQLLVGLNEGFMSKLPTDIAEFLWYSDEIDSKYNNQKEFEANRDIFFAEEHNSLPFLEKHKKYSFVNMLLEASNNLLVYKPDPSKLINLYPLSHESHYLHADTSNLIAFLDILRDKYRDNFEVIEHDLQKCIPEFSRIQLENVPATNDLIKLYGDKTFKRLGLYNPQQKITYWADELSEGTLYFLALLCIIHQPNPPKLLLLEEPEKGIHPRRIKEVIDFIFDLAQKKDIQVIMTTHHPYVVNEFQDIPEAVFIFDKDEEGATQIKNLQTDIIEPSDKANDAQGLPHIKFTQDLAEHWVLGFMGGVPK
jgi:AAA15 family ATPase/GTPase